MSYKNLKYSGLLQKLAKFPIWELELKLEVKPIKRENTARFTEDLDHFNGVANRWKMQNDGRQCQNNYFSSQEPG